MTNSRPEVGPTLILVLALIGCGGGTTASTDGADGPWDASGGETSGKPDTGGSASLDVGSMDRAAVDAGVDAGVADIPMSSDGGIDASPDRLTVQPDAPAEVPTGTGRDGASGATDGGPTGGRRIYAVNYNSANGSDNVTSYPASGAGDVAPIGKIAGPTTKLAGIVQLAFDGTGKAYVLGKNGLVDGTQSIEVFAAGANGDVAPIATIAGSSTGLGAAVSLAVDVAGKIYVAGSIPCATCTSATHPGIMVFAAGANGNVAPQQVIAPAVYPAVDNTGLDAGDLFIGVDAAGNIYVADSYSQKVLVFAAGATGNVAPIRVLTGDKTLLNGCNGIAFDGTGNLFVANYNGMSVTVYPPSASGNTAPKASLAGDKTGIGYLSAFAVDSDGTVYASGQAADSAGRTRSAILRFATGTNGNLAPAGALVGADTEIDATSLAIH